MEDDQEQRRTSALPYDDWTERALRQVVARAVEYVVEKGLPDQHHFYLTFRTDHPGAVIPDRLRAQYPKEMTIVLQHQFWDLAMERPEDVITVGLSFGGVPAKLRIPLDAVIAFADPHVRFGLRFRPIEPADAEAAPAPAAAEPPPPEEDAASAEDKDEPPSSPQVVSLDAFRRRTPPRS